MISQLIRLGSRSVSHADSSHHQHVWIDADSFYTVRTCVLYVHNVTVSVHK